MKETERKVERILRKDERARGDDAYLYCEFLIQFCGINPAEISARDFFLNYRKMGIPSIESIGRFRRFIQEMDDRLKPSKAIQLKRKEYENSFYCYAKDIDNK